MSHTPAQEPFDHHRGRLPLLRPAGRRRTGIYLAVVLTAFALINAFWHYLATGQWVSLSAGSYVADFITPNSLGELFEHPLSVMSYPWMILIDGLLLGTVIFAPIIVAVLYRWEFAAACLVLVLCVGHAPVLTTALAIGCALAARTPLRSDKPFLAVLVAMIPVGLYLYVFTFGSASGAVLPIQRWMLKAPLLLAVASAMAGFAAVLTLARVTGYRPGVAWPIMLVLAAAPLTLFYAKIGTAELDYQLIANRLAAGDALFEPQSVEAWSRQGGAQGLTESALWNRAQGDLEAKKQDLQYRCREFLRRHRRSDRVPAVCWIAAQCQSLQLDRPAYEQGLIQCTAAFAAPAPETSQQGQESSPAAALAAIEGCMPAWKALAQEYPDSPQAALAQWRLGQLMIRTVAVRDMDANDIRQTLQYGAAHLAAAQRKLQDVLAQPASRQEPRKGVTFFWPARSAPLPQYYAWALASANRLVWMIKMNNVLDDAANARALAGYLQADPYGLSPKAYYSLLCRLAMEYEATDLGDNLKLAVATAGGERNADQLVVLAQQQREIDAAIEANFRLAQLTIQNPSLSTLPGMKTPREYLELVKAAPPNPWTEWAGEELRILKGAGRP